MTDAAIRLAREAGLPGYPDDLERFRQLCREELIAEQGAIPPTWTVRIGEATKGEPIKEGEHYKWDVSATPPAGEALDARRYRYLRREVAYPGLDPFIARYNGSFVRWTGGDADALIDAAIAALSAGGEG
jgi:hypothetical protein